VGPAFCRCRRHFVGVLGVDVRLPSLLSDCLANAANASRLRLTMDLEPTRAPSARALLLNRVEAAPGKCAKAYARGLAMLHVSVASALYKMTIAGQVRRKHQWGRWRYYPVDNECSVPVRGDVWG
jgi:hypothetical protein